MATIDERVGGEVAEVRVSLEKERSAKWALEEARSETGDRLIRLEAACARMGLNRSEMIAALREDARGLDLEELTEATIGNRKRMAKFRRQHPPEVARQCLELGVSKQRAIATLAPDRLEEFRRFGVPTADGKRSRLKEARAKEVRQAVKASRGLPPGEPIPTEKLKLTEHKLNPFQLLDLALATFRELGTLSLQQAEEILLMVVSLFAKASCESQRTTRRMMGRIGALDGNEDRTVASDEVLRTVDALTQLLQNVEFGPGLDRFESTTRACGIVSRLLLTISGWTRQAEPGREAG